MTDRPPSADGFTLIEMLVALAVLAIAGLALVRLDAFAVRSASEVELATLARIVAQNEAALVASAPGAPTAGSSRVTNGGASFLVQRAVSGGPVPGTARVDIRVAGQGGGRAALSLLVPAQGTPL